MITVLITGCSMHSADLITELRRNYDDEEIKIVGINCSDDALLRKGVDAGYVVPRIDHPQYISIVLKICEDEGVNVIMPFITAELPIMAKNREVFESRGIKVSVTSEESLYVLNDKRILSNMYGDIMPKQITITKDSDPAELQNFLDYVGYPKKRVCCKLPNRCGGLGFAILDENLGRDLTVLNKFGMPHYITLDMFKIYLASCDDEIIIQEFEDGTDYSLCVLADHGEILFALGFEATVMSFGSAMSARILMNEEALAIARNVALDTDLDGNACFDFILKEDGSVRLLEVNPRLSATLPFIARAGLNLPYLRCKQLLGTDVRSYKPEVNLKLRLSKNYESEYYED